MSATKHNQRLMNDCKRLDRNFWKGFAQNPAEKWPRVEEILKRVQPVGGHAELNGTLLEVAKQVLNCLNPKSPEAYQVFVKASPILETKTSIRQHEPALFEQCAASFQAESHVVGIGQAIGDGMGQAQRFVGAAAQGAKRAVEHKDPTASLPSGATLQAHCEEFIRWQTGSLELLFQAQTETVERAHRKDRLLLAELLASVQTRAAAALIDVSPSDKSRIQGEIASLMRSRSLAEVIAGKKTMAALSAATLKKNEASVYYLLRDLVLVMCRHLWTGLKPHEKRTFTYHPLGVRLLEAVSQTAFLQTLHAVSMPQEFFGSLLRYLNKCSKQESSLLTIFSSTNTKQKPIPVLQATFTPLASGFSAVVRIACQHESDFSNLLQSQGKFFSALSYFEQNLQSGSSNFTSACKNALRACSKSQPAASHAKTLETVAILPFDAGEFVIPLPQPTALKLLDQWTLKLRGLCKTMSARMPQTFTEPESGTALLLAHHSTVVAACRHIERSVSVLELVAPPPYHLIKRAQELMKKNAEGLKSALDLSVALLDFSTFVVERVPAQAWSEHHRTSFIASLRLVTAFLDRCVFSFSWDTLSHRRQRAADCARSLSLLCKGLPQELELQALFLRHVQSLFIVSLSETPDFIKYEPDLAAWQRDFWSLLADPQRLQAPLQPLGNPCGLMLFFHLFSSPLEFEPELREFPLPLLPFADVVIDKLRGGNPLTYLAESSDLKVFIFWTLYGIHLACQIPERGQSSVFSAGSLCAQRFGMQSADMHTVRTSLQIHKQFLSELAATCGTNILADLDESSTDDKNHTSQDETILWSVLDFVLHAFNEADAIKFVVKAAGATVWHLSTLKFLYTVLLTQGTLGGVSDTACKVILKSLVILGREQVIHEHRWQVIEKALAPSAEKDPKQCVFELNAVFGDFKPLFKKFLGILKPMQPGTHCVFLWTSKESLVSTPESVISLAQRERFVLEQIDDFVKPADEDDDDDFLSDEMASMRFDEMNEKFQRHKSTKR